MQHYSPRFAVINASTLTWHRKVSYNLQGMLVRIDFGFHQRWWTTNHHETTPWRQKTLFGWPVQLGLCVNKYAHDDLRTIQPSRWWFGAVYENKITKTLPSFSWIWHFSYTIFKKKWKPISLLSSRKNGRSVRYCSVKTLLEHGKTYRCVYTERKKIEFMQKNWRGVNVFILSS